MKTSLIRLLFILIGAIDAFADGDLYKQFLADQGVLRDSYGMYSQLPNPLYLYRFHFDKLEQKLVFVNWSLELPEQGWSAYKYPVNGANQNYKRLPIELAWRGFHCDTQSKSAKIQVTWHRKGVSVVEEYFFNKAGDLHTEVRSLSEDEEDQLRVGMLTGGEAFRAKFLKLGSRFKPEVEKILLSELIRGKGKWRPINQKFDLEHQEGDPGDKKAIAAGKDLTRDEVVKWLRDTGGKK